MVPEFVSPFDNDIDPDCISRIPVLLNTAGNTLVPPAPDFVNVPALLKVNAAPPRFPMSASLCRSSVPLFVNTAALPMLMLPVPFHVTAPNAFNTRPRFKVFVPAPVMFIPPFAFTVPAPLNTPLVHDVSPDTFTVSVPVSVPPLNVNV